jgi:lipopolysaccharide transport system permease protein
MHNSNSKSTAGEMAGMHWDMEIKPRQHLLQINLKEIWQYRDLLLLLVRRDFVSFYKQTILGPLWFFIQPLFTTLIYTFIFANLAGISTQGIPAPLFYMAGITCWNYFSECLTKTSTVFRDNAAVFGKVYFPRLIIPISIVISNLVRFGVQLLLLLLMMCWYSWKGANLHISVMIALFPLLVLLMALLGLGAGLIITALTTKYRDLAFLVTFGVQLLMYTTTVVYPLAEAIAKYPQHAWLFQLNPMTVILESFRLSLFGSGTFSWAALGGSIATTLAITGVGVVVFNRVERSFIDTV